MKDDRIAPPEALEQGIFLISGIMASGKSTVAQQLAERFARGVHLRGDTFRRMIVSGREEMLPDATEEAVNQLNLRYRIAASAADEYCRAGFAVVVQDVIVGPSLERFVDWIQSRPLFVIVLNPNLETVARREAARPKKGYGPGSWTITGLNDVLVKETPRIGWWLDSSDLTPEETVNEILEKAWTHARIK
ncbi:AAA family ATPase [Paenibacillus sp. 32O-W]|uniref:AAA family ATPase n=1 Tax=Paenibacillus sp. 32O-W TaxID=1695218 RepID=UPI00119E1D87|nr:AAA family ATPase [Paenibacillus sp. 32O-W]